MCVSLHVNNFDEEALGATSHGNYLKHVDHKVHSLMLTDNEQPFLLHSTTNYMEMPSVS